MATILRGGPRDTSKCRWVRGEWVRESVIESAIPWVRETPWKYGEWPFVRGYQMPMQLGVEVRAPGKRIGFWKGGSGHDMERFAEVWRERLEVHESTIKGEVWFV